MEILIFLPVVLEKEEQKRIKSKNGYAVPIKSKMNQIQNFLMDNGMVEGA